MNLTAFTDVIILASILGLGLYDVVPAAFTPDKADTISERIRHHTGRWWVQPLAWGVLGGHWWGPPIPRPPWGPLTLLLLGLSLLALCAARVWERERWGVRDLVLFLCGIPLGALLWSLP